ncbi:hypothetical protein I4000191A8_28060 [Clostridia bacterium i40-0019-1A8]
MCLVSHGNRVCEKDRQKSANRICRIFIGKNSWKMENIRINMVSISKSVKRKLQQMKEPYVTIYTKKYRVMEE